MNEIKCNLDQILELKNHTATSVDLYIYSDIVSAQVTEANEETYPSKIRNFLDEANGRDVNIYINSGGGNVFAGYGIASMIQRYSGRTRAYIDGVCASIATAIYLAADEQYVSEQGLFMYHQAWGGLFAVGNAKQIMAEAKVTSERLGIINDSLLSMYKSKASSDDNYKTIEKNLNSGKDSWLNADETCSFFNAQKANRGQIAYAKLENIDVDAAPEVLFAKAEIVTNEAPKRDLSKEYKFETIGGY